MNRRSFFRTLGLGAAAVAAQVYLPKLPDRMRWKATRQGDIYVVNPEWVNAPYEVWFAFDPPPAWMPGTDPTKVHPIVFKRGEFGLQWSGKQFVKDPFPIRLNELGGVPVPAMKKLESSA